MAVLIIIFKLGCTWDIFFISRGTNNITVYVHSLVQGKLVVSIVNLRSCLVTTFCSFSFFFRAAELAMEYLFAISYMCGYCPFSKWSIAYSDCSKLSTRCGCFLCCTLPVPQDDIICDETHRGERCADITTFAQVAEGQAAISSQSAFLLCLFYQCLM